MGCLDAQVVTALFAGTLSREDRDRIDDHVDTCETCRRWVANAARDHVGRASQSTAPAVEASTGAETMPGRAPDRVTLTLGAQIGRYVVRDFLGAGAMGAVYAAHDPQLDRVVALKVMRAGAGSSTEGHNARFVREAKAMARVSHPNVVPIFDAGEADGIVFIAMKRVDGASLRRHLTAAKPSRRERLRLLCDAGRGLAAAHAAGIVHRDFKPDNVLVEKGGTAQVADFGLARGLGDGLARGLGDGVARGLGDGVARELGDGVARELGDGVARGLGDGVAPELAGATPEAGDELARGTPWETSAGAILGTPAYMAPEVKRGERGDERSDQYSYAVAVDEVLGPKKPRRVQRALQRALAHDPVRRFASIGQLVDVLERRTVVPWIAAAVAAAIGLAVIAWPSRGDTVAECDEAGDRRIAGVLGPTERAAVVAHLGTMRQLHSRDAEGTVAQLDRQIADWRTLRRSTCRARTELSAELYDLRMACLDRRLDEVAVVRRSLLALPADRADAVARLGGALGEIAACTNPKSLRAGAERDVASRTWSYMLRMRLFEAHTVLQQGDYKRALAVFDSVLAESRAARLESVEAEALLARAIVLDQTHQPGSQESFHKVREIGERIGDPGLRADALNSLLASAATDPARASEVELLAKMIESALAEMPAEDTANRRGILNGNLANYYRLRKDFATAEKHVLEAKRLFTEKVGATHPYTLMARNTEADLYSRQGKTDQALAILRGILADIRKTYGEEHALVAENELSIGVLLAHAQHRDEASVSFQRALAIYEKVYGPDHVRVADALRKVGYFEMDRDVKAARAAFTRAVAILHKATGRDTPQLAPLLTGLGEAELLTGDPAAAVATLERAFAAWGDSKVSPHLIPTAKFSLARALWDSKGDRTRARRLAAEAHGEFLAVGGPLAALAKEVAAWQKTHR